LDYLYNLNKIEIKFKQIQELYEIYWGYSLATLEDDTSDFVVIETACIARVDFGQALTVEWYLYEVVAMEQN